MHSTHVKGTAHVRAAPGLLALALLLGACAQTRQAPTGATLRQQDVAYSPPITITRGGTYSGNWESTDPDVPAVSVQTSEPVIIENSHIRSAGEGIHAFAQGGNLTVRNSFGDGLNPNVAGRQKGQFIYSANFSSLVVEHNSVDGTRTAVDAANPVAGATLMVDHNRFHNIDGRRSDGAGGYQPALDGSFANAVGLNTVQGANVEIAWNELINEPYQSRTEDAISSYESSGTPGHPIDIHDNYLQGDYAPDPAAPVPYSGAVINVGDAYTCQTSPNSCDADRVGHVHVHHNQVVSFEDVGIIISSGHDNEVDHNRVLSAQQAPDGTVLGGLWRPGLGLSDYYAAFSPIDSANWYNNSVHDNAVNVVSADGTASNDYLPALGTPDAAVKNITAYNNVNTWGHLATVADMQEEYQLWQSKLSANGVQLGPQDSATPPAQTGPAANAKITVYEHANYGGRAQSFGTGTYNAAHLNIVGNDAISSLKVPAGLQVRACEHNDAGGRCVTYIGNVPDVGDDMNDCISSLKVTVVAAHP